MKWLTFHISIYPGTRIKGLCCFLLSSFAQLHSAGEKGAARRSAGLEVHCGIISMFSCWLCLSSSLPVLLSSNRLTCCLWAAFPGARVEATQMAELPQCPSATSYWYSDSRGEEKQVPPLDGRSLKNLMETVNL